ncbi:6-phosphogluconolactonase [Desulfocapsa sulfexigens DSM 10523]|uniref:6-phosphogluconolactonase n=1 Tax=Desulfocapsa sulfexigens (strain DSM 10523 / SB164P1) TaxID=1167006 RepID=M1P5C8_DESSD|nr:6-phosphogluconolactonase [Desulfocapsa sulfexigens]AGF76897.1 6-phosphogluconolactonase [Desulfocapsa sulfexigens DSM 10523]
MNHSINLHSFSDKDSLITDLTLKIAALLNAGIKKNGRAGLAVSGGSTPVQLFKSLSNSDIPWHTVDITLVDERWVPPDNQDSNEHLVRSHLLQNRAATASFTGMWNTAATAQDGEALCAERLQNTHHPIDVLILGLGNDGHTASLFPGAARLPQATDMNSGKICMAITPVTAPHERMTLTLPAILNAKQIFLHITGQNKKDVLEQALGDGPSEEMPIRFILQQQTQKTNFNVYWAN